MGAQTSSRIRRRAGLTGLVLTLAAGLLCWWTHALDGLSYDSMFWIKPPARPAEAVIVSMDETSFGVLKQKPQSWDRTLHAQLLDRLTEDRARLVVFDIVFLDEETALTGEALAKATRANEALARAVRRAVTNKVNVLLAAKLDYRAGPLMVISRVAPPLPFLQEAGARYGISELIPDSVIRRSYVGEDTSMESLPWRALQMLDHPLVRRLGEEPPWWLNYYGPHGTIATVSYCEATNQPAGFFTDKIAFVGGGLRARYAIDVADEHRTPYTQVNGRKSPGVEITATAVMNLMHEEYLLRMPAWQESLWLFGCALLFGWGLCLLRPLPAALAAVGGAVVTALVAVWLLQSHQVWYPWLIPAVVQIPCALVWSLASSFRAAAAAPAVPATQAVPLPAPVVGPGAGPTPPLPSPSPNAPTLVVRRVPPVPDHTMLRTVGKGAYGEVWLARNAIGTFHAVKVVYRDAFESSEPYEREFRGIQKFMPVSLHHPKLVHLLHVGRNDQEGFLFYIMEVADDENRGTTIDPVDYSPRNLSRELKKRGRLPVRECLGLGLDLAAALDYLHQNQLIHRDIKPANIIYVRGVPKIADIGLVTEVARHGQGVTYVGTEGYMPPEGPGSTGADVYSLGKVLYEACSGLPVSRFPEMPKTLLEQAGSEGLSELNQIVLKACESDPALRYASAAALRAALVKVQLRLEGPAAPAGTVLAS